MIKGMDGYVMYNVFGEMSVQVKMDSGGCPTCLCVTN